MTAQSKRGLKPGSTNNINGRPQVHGERKKYNLRLPTDLMQRVEENSSNKTEFIIQAISAALSNIESR